MAEKEYIEREAIINKIVNTPTVPSRQYYKGNFVYADGVSGRQNEIINYINEQPAADVAPVKHGHWNVGYFHDRVCSCCTHPSNNLDDYPYKFCPHCGAKMDGGAENAKHTGNNDNLP